MSTALVVLPEEESAPLPARYEAARVALAECERIDECKDWADRMAALASYARQAEDDSLFLLARRIQVRAVRRSGELLRQFDGRGRPKNGRGAPTILPPSRQQVAAAAGLSRDQTIQAVRVANVPAARFEEAVEGNDPPTVTELAEWGKGDGKARPTRLVDNYLDGADRFAVGLRRALDDPDLGGRFRPFREMVAEKHREIREGMERLEQAIGEG